MEDGIYLAWNQRFHGFPAEKRETALATAKQKQYIRSLMCQCGFADWNELKIACHVWGVHKSKRYAPNIVLEGDPPTMDHLTVRQASSAITFLKRITNGKQ